MTTSQPWYKRIGNQRDWVWRGWQIRYSYTRPESGACKLPPIILIHGFGASIEHWRHNIPFLARNHQVYAIDLLGFGASRKADAEYGMELWSEQLHDFWQNLVKAPAILVGNSLGSLVCLNATALYPQMVAGLSMLSLPDVSVREDMLPAPIRPVVTAVENIFASPWLIKGILKIVRRPAIIRRWAGVAYPNKAAVTDELVEILSSPAFDQGAAQTLVRLSRSVRQASFAQSVSVLLPQVQIPMLLIWGVQDKMIPPRQAKAIARLNPLVKLVELPGVGHCPHDEEPELFNQLFWEWLESVGLTVKNRS